MTTITVTNTVQGVTVEYDLHDLHVSTTGKQELLWKIAFAEIIQIEFFDLCMIVRALTPRLGKFGDIFLTEEWLCYDYNGNQCVPSMFRVCYEEPYSGKPPEPILIIKNKKNE
jgi:hypothetical protein